MGAGATMLTTFPPQTSKGFIQGPQGKLELAVDLPRGDILPFTGIVCHPHPLYGGTMQNKSGNHRSTSIT